MEQAERSLIITVHDLQGGVGRSTPANHLIFDAFFRTYYLAPKESEIIDRLKFFAPPPLRTRLKFFTPPRDTSEIFRPP